MKVLITGASRGIGREIALTLLKQGNDVTGTSRSLEGQSVFPMLKLDLADKNSIRLCAKQAGDIDVLINNAGVSQMGAVEELPVDKMRDLFEANFFGLIELTKCFLPQMRQRRSGFIINIGSLAGKFAVPFKSSYVASKFALAGFSWSLRNEVMPFGIKVTVVEPSDINTTIEPEIFTREGSEYAINLDKVKRARAESMSKSPSPRLVAAKVSEILKKHLNNSSRPAPFYAVGKNASLNVLAKRFAPDSFIEKMVKKSYGL